MNCWESKYKVVKHVAPSSYRVQIRIFCDPVNNTCPGTLNPRVWKSCPVCIDWRYESWLRVNRMSRSMEFQSKLEWPVSAWPFIHTKSSMWVWLWTTKSISQTMLYFCHVLMLSINDVYSCHILKIEPFRNFFPTIQWNILDLIF